MIDESEHLADVLGISTAEFVELFGAMWRRSPTEPWHDYDSDPSGGEDCLTTPWHIAGDPVQLMLRVFHHGVFIGLPTAVRRGVHELDYHAREQQYLRVDELEQLAPAVVKRVLTARRRSFRYCRYCREATAPEHRFSDDTCQGCASTWHGVVY
ncbi:hypothetical protein [Nocardioides sp. SYSU DS0651]|uniref:hypothetical protein n=1 Tax=Nocardioides sp. SYSU DS0651 TaxID=3415955 RepID=UPI003F4C3605